MSQRIVRVCFSIHSPLSAETCGVIVHGRFWSEKILQYGLRGSLDSYKENYNFLPVKANVERDKEANDLERQCLALQSYKAVVNLTTRTVTLQTIVDLYKEANNLARQS